MKIAVIAVASQEYSRSRLSESVKQRGHTPIMLIPEDLSASIENSRPALKLKGKSFEPDGIIHIMSTDFLYGHSILKIAAAKIPHINSTEAVLASANKFQTAAILNDNKLPYPKTTLVLNNKDLAFYAKRYGYPVILKQPDGAQGREVALAKSDKDLLAQAGSIRKRGFPLLVQEFVEESKGEDIRIIVVGDKVVAAMKRRAGNPEEFRANLHLGGTAETISLNPQENEIAIHATKALGLDLAGVDILRSNRGPLITELNSFPGLKGIESCTGIDVAGTIVDLLMRKIDYLQR